MHLFSWILMNKKALNIFFNFVLFTGLGGYLAYTKGWILADFESLSVEQAHQIIQSDNHAMIVDVRTPEEFKNGHLKNAVSIPLGSLEQHTSKFSQGQKLLVYCQSGNRSVAASRVLSSKGFTPYNVKGGINAWIAAGYAVVR